MKSIVMKSIYTGLGLLGSGKETVEQMASRLAKQANISEKDGERIAKELRARSEKVVHALSKSLDAEVTKVVHAVRAATKEMTGTQKKASTHHRKKKRAVAKK
jgi:hypothetical protein